MDISPTTIITLIQTGGATVVLVLAVYAFMTNKVYTAQTYKEQLARAERAEQELGLYRTITPRNSDNLQRIAELLRETLVQPPPAGPQP